MRYATFMKLSPTIPVHFRTSLTRRANAELHVVSSAMSRLNLAKSQYQSEMREVINSTPRGEEFIDKSCEIALEAFAEIKNLIPQNETEPGNGMSCS